MTAIVAWLSARRDDRGATAVEYGIMVAAVAAGLVLLISGMMNGLEAAFDAMIGGIQD